MNRGEFQAVSAFWQAKQSKLNYLREAKEVGDVADFESFWAKTISESRAKILGIPTRFKQACPELLAGQMAALNQIVRECLEALGRDG
jgi:hypothetical protein